MVKARVAVLGTGSIGMRHLEVLRAMDGNYPIAVPKRPERAGRLQKAGFEAALDLGDAIQRGATHCIIATDTADHLADGLAALDLGLPILVEKPMAANAADAGHLSRCARTHELGLFVGCVLRFSESLNAFRRLLHQVGRLHSVQIECRSYLPDWPLGRPYRDTFRARAGQGGVLLDMVHDIDYGGWIFGWPDSVQALLRSTGILGIDAEELAELSWQTPSGCGVSTGLDYLTRPARRGIRASGELGTITWNGIEGTVTVQANGKSPQSIRSTQTRDEMFAAQAKAFLLACSGGVGRLSTAEEGTRALAICDAARRSSDSRRLEPVAYP